MKRHFQTFWDWVILLGLLVAFAYVLLILAAGRPAPQPQPPVPTLQDEIRDLRSRVEALELIQRKIFLDQIQQPRSRVEALERRSQP